MFEKVEKPDSETQRFRQVLKRGIDGLAAAIARDDKFKGFDIQSKTELPQLRTPKNQEAAEKSVRTALSKRLENATATRVNSISDIHITPEGRVPKGTTKPVVKVEVKFSDGEITKVPIGSTPLSSHDYVVFVDTTGYRWAKSDELVKFAQNRESVKGKAAFSAQDILGGKTAPPESGATFAAGAVDMTKGEYEYITKLIRSRIAKARGDIDKADISYTMPFTIDGAKVRVDLKFESLFREYISELLKE